MADYANVRYQAVYDPGCKTVVGPTADRPVLVYIPE
jgi:hypothetical protein